MAASIPIGTASGAAGCEPQLKAPAASVPRTCATLTSPGKSPKPVGEPTQTIALVDAYNDPDAESDLEAYDEEFNQAGETDS